MSFEPKSISDQIECLAQMTGASRNFIDQVKQLFTRKGISLRTEASPYISALEEAFRREEVIRANSRRAREKLSDTRRNFSKMGRAYVRQVQLRKAQADLKKQGRAVAAVRPRRTGSSPTVTIAGDHRSFVTRPQREDLPLVPGPEELQ